jgi:hypothetical protein
MSKEEKNKGLLNEEMNMVTELACMGFDLAPNTDQPSMGCWVPSNTWGILHFMYPLW